MTKVIKTSTIELAADFEEIFDGANVEEATEKAHNQKMPSEFAKVNITEHKLVSANIKVIGEVNDELKKQQHKVVHKARQSTQKNYGCQRKRKTMCQHSARLQGI